MRVCVAELVFKAVDILVASVNIFVKTRLLGLKRFNLGLRVIRSLSLRIFRLLKLLVLFLRLS